MRAIPCSACLALCLWLPISSSPVPAGAQEIPEADGWASDAVGEAAFLSVNAVVGGLTAGLWQELTGGSFAEGLAGGVLGGSVVYAGKRVAASSFPGAGFLGRDLAATGSSVVRNAAEARPLLDSLSLPAGPFRLYVSPRVLEAPRVELELSDLYWTAYGLAESRLELDLSGSLSSGAPVFRSDRSLLSGSGESIHGAAAGGVIFLSPMGEGQRQETLAHERVHVLQLDFVHQAWLRPLEAKLARRLPHEGWRRRLDYDVIFPALRWTAGLLGPDVGVDGPIEAEAEFLGQR